jgi:hypothetical protein
LGGVGGWGGWDGGWQGRAGGCECGAKAGKVSAAGRGRVSPRLWRAGRLRSRWGLNGAATQAGGLGQGDWAGRSESSSRPGSAGAGLRSEGSGEAMAGGRLWGLVGPGRQSQMSMQLTSQATAIDRLVRWCVWGSRDGQVCQRQRVRGRVQGRHAARARWWRGLGEMGRAAGAGRAWRGARRVAARRTWRSCRGPEGPGRGVGAGV